MQYKYTATCDSMAIKTTDLFNIKNVLFSNIRLKVQFY